jgi:hypothetical protein
MTVYTSPLTLQPILAHIHFSFINFRACLVAYHLERGYINCQFRPLTQRPLHPACLVLPHHFLSPSSSSAQPALPINLTATTHFEINGASKSSHLVDHLDIFYGACPCSSFSVSAEVVHWLYLTFHPKWVAEDNSLI